MRGATALLCLGIGFAAGGLVFLETDSKVASGIPPVGPPSTRCDNNPTLFSADFDSDGTIGLPDAIGLLAYMFTGGPPPFCISFSLELPDTGLTTCYDAFGNAVDCVTGPCAGQDGLYETGCPNDAGRFEATTPLGDAVVIDNCTGLMWQQAMGNNGNQLNWCGALDYCDTLDFAGHDDWRLPNVRELQSIVDYGRSTPSIDPVFSTSNSPFWSSTSGAVLPGNAWSVHFVHGVVELDPKQIGRNVRAVRSLP